MITVDGTLAWAATRGVLERFAQCRVIGIDRDREALGCGERLARFGTASRRSTERPDRQGLLAAGLQHVDESCSTSGSARSSSTRRTAASPTASTRPLDMRMDQTSGVTAANVLNEYPVEELTRILRDYGEALRPQDRGGHRPERATEPFTTSARLVELLRRVIPVASQRQSGHPAKRTFQALRIEVNDELGGWERAVTAAIDVLGVGGRMAALSFHSLEDRLTKRAIAARDDLQHTARAARRAAGARPLPPCPDAWGRGRRRGPREPAGRLRQAPGRRTDPRHRRHGGHSHPAPALHRRPGASMQEGAVR